MGQKRRCILLPLSATLWKSRVSPRTEISVDGKQTDTAAFPVAIYWQRRHQQRRAVRGSAFVSYRTAPQRHPPVITEAPPQEATRIRHEAGCPSIAARVRAAIALRRERPSCLKMAPNGNSYGLKWDNAPRQRRKPERAETPPLSWGGCVHDGAARRRDARTPTQRAGLAIRP
jgi:hypothetical protein